MQRLLLVLLVMTLSGPATAAREQVLRRQLVVEPARQSAQMARLSPSLHDWVGRQARATIDSQAEPNPQDMEAAVRTRLAGQDFSNADVETLVQLVMAESARQAEADLRSMMDQMQAINERKARQREAMAAEKQAQQSASNAARAEYAGTRQPAKVFCVDPPCRAPVLATPRREAQIQPGTARAKPELDSMSEMGEMESMRLQMLMDRRSKALETLSNLLKKQADTASAITSNLK